VSAPDDRLPIFPLGTVLFPGGALPLRVFETRYVDMTRDCLKNEHPFGVCLIREGREVGAPAVPEKVGCIARIVECDMQQLGVINLLTRGEERFRILKSSSTSQGLVVADIEPIPPERDTPVPPEYEDCARLLLRLVDAHGEGLFTPPHRFDSARWVGYRLAEVLPLPLPVKQKLLEMDDPVERLSVLHRVLAASRQADD
jgi:Lon protease-like protein